MISRGALGALLVRHAAARGCPVLSPADERVPESLDTCAQSFGRLLARFHEAVEDFDAPTGSEWTRLHPLALVGVDAEWIDRLFWHDPAEGAVLVDWREQAVTALADTSTATSAPDRGMCHGEAYPATCRREGDELAIAELDWAGEGHRAYDLATYRWTLAVHTPDRADELFSQFVEAYATVRDVPELRSLSAYVAVRHLWSLRIAAGFANVAGLRRRVEFAARWPITS